MTTRTEQAEAKVAATLTRMTTRQLTEAYDLAGAAQSDLTKDRQRTSDPAIVSKIEADHALLATTRGWLQDELERRDKATFDAWIDSADFSGSPAKFFFPEV